MTNSSLSSSKSFRRRASAALLLLASLGGVAGCGPKDGVAELEQGKAAYAARDLKSAERLFSRSLMLAPKDVDRLLYLARVKLDLADLGAARDLAAKARALAPDDCDTALFAAQVAWHDKDYDSAARLYGALAEDARLEAAVRAQAWSGLGVVEMSRENPHVARLACLRAIRTDRRDAAAWYHLGVLYRDLGYYEAALDQFNVYVRLEASASPRVQKVQRRVIPGLQETIARATADRPGVSRRNSAACAAALAKADAAMKRNRPKEARSAYQQALAADPLSYPAALGLAQAWERSDVTTAGQTRALEAYKVACSLRASATRTFLSTGALALKLGYPSQAVEAYSRAVAANPVSYDALDGLIRALRKVGGRENEKIAQAYQAYRTAITKRK